MHIRNEKRVKKHKRENEVETGPIIDIPFDILGAIGQYLTYYNFLLLLSTFKHFYNYLNHPSTFLKSENRLITEDSITLVIQRDRNIYEYTHSAETILPTKLNINLVPGDSIEDVYIYSIHSTLRYILVQTVRDRFYLTSSPFKGDSHILNEITFKIRPRSKLLEKPLLGENFIMLKDQGANLYTYGKYGKYSLNFVKRHPQSLQNKKIKRIFVDTSMAFILTENDTNLFLYGEGFNNKVSLVPNKFTAIKPVTFPLHQDESISTILFSYWYSIYVTNNNRLLVSGVYISPKAFVFEPGFSEIPLLLNSNEQIKRIILNHSAIYLLSNQNRLLYCLNINEGFNELSLPLNPGESLQDIYNQFTFKYVFNKPYCFVSTTNNQLFKVTTRDVELLPFKNIQRIIFNKHIFLINKDNSFAIANLNKTNFIIPNEISFHSLQQMWIVNYSVQALNNSSLFIMIVTHNKFILLGYKKNQHNEYGLPFYQKEILKKLNVVQLSISPKENSINPAKRFCPENYKDDSMNRFFSLQQPFDYDISEEDTMNLEL